MKELEFLEIIKNTLSKNTYIGDDCAYLKDLGIVITQDSLVENVHFSLSFSTPYQLAYKAILVNLSDILAAGAAPKYLTVSLSIPNYLSDTETQSSLPLTPALSIGQADTLPSKARKLAKKRICHKGRGGDCQYNFISEFYKACEDLSAEYGFEIVGGDITGSSKLFISICAIGLTKTRKISSRKNAKVGDYVVTTGVHGSSAAGLCLLMENEKWKMENGKDAKMQRCKDAECHCEESCLQEDEAIQDYPSPEFLALGGKPPRAETLPSPARGEGATTHCSLLTAHLTPTLAKDFSQEISTKIDRDYAMMDTSDGLVDALFKIAQASNVLISVDFDKIPYDKEIEKIAQSADIDFKNWIFYGGEDYQLIACVDEVNLKKLTSPYTIIGKVEEKNSKHFVQIISDKHIEKISDLEQTFNHFD